MFIRRFHMHSAVSFLFGGFIFCSAFSFLLDDFEVDETARQALFLLGSRDPVGWRYANDILAKIQGHRRGHYRNISGWIHKSVANARREIGQEAVAEAEGFYRPSSVVGDNR